MPGCIIPGCHTNRNNKAYDGISLFKLPNCAGDFYQNWKHRIVDVLKRYLSMDGEAWEQRIKSGKVWMCERHYKPEDFERTSKCDQSPVPSDMLRWNMINRKCACWWENTSKNNCDFSCLYFDHLRSSKSLSTRKNMRQKNNQFQCKYGLYKEAIEIAT